MIVGWAFLSPLSKYQGWAPGEVSASADGGRGWILWPSLAIMISESLLSISLVAFTTLYASDKKKELSRNSLTGENEMDDEEEEEGEEEYVNEEEADMRVILGGVALR